MLPPVDGLTWRAYEADLVHLIENLRDRLQRGAYRASPPHGGNTYQSQTDANARSQSPPLRIKIVQRATVAVLNAIYEEDFTQ